MNGLHAIGLKEEDSKAVGGSWSGELCNVWVGAECPELHRQTSIIHTGVNSCDRGFMSLSSMRTLGLVSVSLDKMCIRLRCAECRTPSQRRPGSGLCQRWHLEGYRKPSAETGSQHRLMTLSLNHNTIHVQSGSAHRQAQGFRHTPLRAKRRVCVPHIRALIRHTADHQIS